MCGEVRTCGPGPNFGGRGIRLADCDTRSTFHAALLEIIYPHKGRGVRDSLARDIAEVPGVVAAGGGVGGAGGARRGWWGRQQRSRSPALHRFTAHADARADRALSRKPACDAGARAETQPTPFISRPPFSAITSRKVGRDIRSESDVLHAFSTRLSAILEDSMDFMLNQTRKFQERRTK